jgi:hypothetical protein
MTTRPVITFKRIQEYNSQVSVLGMMLGDEIEYPYDVERGLAVMKNMLSNDVFFCLGAYDDDKLVGMLCVLKVDDLFMPNATTAAEQFWYVLPSYRKGTGLQLVKELEKMLEVDKIQFGISNSLLQRLLLREGYTYKKTILEKVL